MPPALRLVAVQARVVVAEDRRFYWTVGGAERLQRVFFAQVFRDLERRNASICHCGEPVQMASVPQQT